MDSDSSPNQASESPKSPPNQQSQGQDSENREDPKEVPQQIPDNEQSNVDSTGDYGETDEHRRQEENEPNSPVHVTPQKKRVMIDSDDEEETPAENPEEPAPESQHQQDQDQPTSSSRILNSDDDGDIVVQKRRTVIDDDEFVEKEEGERSKSGSPVGHSQKRRNLIGSDLSDNSDNEEEPTKRNTEDVGELMANIFGKDSDDEEEQPKKEETQQEEGQNEDDDDGEIRDRHERDESDFQWDFDTMMQKKKQERSRHRRRRKDGGIDIINDDDGTIAAMVETMRAAAKDDRTSNIERRPALRKRKMLSEVKAMLIRADLAETMMDNGMLSAVSEWLAPLPDKSLPALEIRTTILKILQSFNRLEASILKQSGVGKAVMLLYKHPRETKENKEMAAKLIREWSRPIFQLDTDFRSLTKEERLERDLEHMPAAKRRRLSVDDEGNATSVSTTKTPTTLTEAPSSSSSTPLGPRDKGFINRARVPRPSTKDYVIRPKSTIEGEFKGERKSKAMSRLDRATRDFKERTKKNKAQRAVGVSLEGRNLAI
ncbi:hypothetical protein WR25_08612 [Diploscapter pachys]|uniref:TFIIS N-terminal domain-containing protein n=1 Tax=Diploscapter pachys TaxID=2018661 RepID=A0A2A2L0M5_9BILA|nr:hypothetical protein WR25_08612 [Diploscapter pachys]